MNRPPIVAVFGASSAVPGDGAYEAGVRCGRLLVDAGFGVATGGYGGVMEAVSRGAAEAGGIVLGMTAPSVFPDRPGANRWVAEELPSPTLIDRIRDLTDASVGAVALPGSLGTLTELTLAWNLAFVARFARTDPKPVVTVGAHWREVVEFVARATETDASLVTCVDDVDAAVAAVARSLGHPDR